ncbi:kyphoscoliosis peptidase [Arapaima gigas]
MAFLDHLSKTQKILLAVFCFPLLPFYLCYVCCCASDTESEEVEEHKGHKQITVEIHPKNRTPSLRKKFSFGKGKVSPKNEAAHDNKGFVNDQNSTQGYKTNVYVYPWDGSNLKSMLIDLNQFKQLDDYASKVGARNSVKALVQDLLKGTNRDIEKLRSIWMWVTHHIEYDVQGYFNPSQRSGSPDDVLRTGKGVCAGYSSVFQQMCSLAGIECQKVSGHSKGFQYKPGKRFTGSGDHAWNAIRLDGKWHLLDSTWGAGHVSKDGHRFTFKYNEFYFLTHPALFVEDHFPLDGQWQLLKPQRSLKQFEDAMLKKSGFYNSGLLSVKPEAPTIKSDGKTTVTINSSAPRLFMMSLNGKENHGILTLRPDGMKVDVYPPEVGTHTLSIYCKDPDSFQNMYEHVCEYEIQCKAVNKEMRFLEDLNNPVGPSWLSEQHGLREPSQREPMVRTNDGRCSFGFRVENHLALMAMLKTREFRMTDDQQRRHVFQSKKGDHVEFLVQVPRPGLYQLSIYGNNKSESEKYNYICSYIIFCNNPKVNWPVYPLQYATWKEDYELVEPLSGVLPADREVHFKLRVPGVSQVSVKARDRHNLSLGADGFWSGSCRTTGCVDINVMIKEKMADCTSSFILNYVVENNSASSPPAPVQTTISSTASSPPAPVWTITSSFALHHHLQLRIIASSSDLAHFALKPTASVSQKNQN